MSSLLTINTDQLQLFGRETRPCLKIRNRGLLFHCCWFMTLKHGYFWHKPGLGLLIKVVCPEDCAWCKELWSSLCRSSTQITPVFLGPPPFSQVPEQLPVWEKTQFNQNSSFCCLSEGEEWGGEGQTKRGESKEGRVVCKGRVLIKEEEWVSLLTNQRADREKKRS